MPSVEMDIVITAPPDIVWEAVNDIESYPKIMKSVLFVEILSRPARNERVSKWSATLKGSILEWTEQEWVDPSNLIIRFQQIDGDLDIFEGHWALEPDGEKVHVTLSVNFEIGIPLLADMLNPVAIRAIRENSQSMLRDIESRVRNMKVGLAEEV